MQGPVTYEKIAPMTIGGAGAGNTYRFKVSYFTSDGNPITTLSANERDAAWTFERCGQPVPEELAGPYDGFGRKEDAA
jgi:hypothetical protein